MRRKAVALIYNSNEKAPRVIAKGYNRIAEKIIEIAKRNEIPIEFDNFLVDVLIQLEIGDYIPEELYEILAEILAFVYKMRMSGQ